MAEALLTRQRILAAKTEVTIGSPEGLAAADAAHDVFDPEMTPDIDFIDRMPQSALSPQQGSTGGHRSQCTFQTEVANTGGSGVPLWANTFLQACAFSVSGQTYTVESGSGSYETISMGLYEDGRLRQMAGCVGDLTATFTAGRPGIIDWTFQGKYVNETTVGLLTPTYPTVLPPRFASATFDIASTAYRVNEVTLAMNNEIKMIEDVADDTNTGVGTGYHAGVVTNRRIVWTADVEAATGKDWYADLTGHIEMDITLALGEGANNIITFNSPKAQLTNVQPGDRDGILVDQLTFVANRSAAAGDDELTIAFS